TTPTPTGGSVRSTSNSGPTRATGSPNSTLNLPRSATSFRRYERGWQDCPRCLWGHQADPRHDDARISPGIALHCRRPARPDLPGLPRPGATSAVDPAGRQRLLRPGGRACLARGRGRPDPTGGRRIKGRGNAREREASMTEADDHGLTHLNESGAAHMVDVSEKAVTQRLARASASVRMR